MRGFISYAIPTYSRRKLTTQAVVSAAIEAKPWADPEIVISDNHSPDNEVFILPKYWHNQKRLRELNLRAISPLYQLPIIDNWIHALLHTSHPIVKLLFSDDLVVDVPSKESLSSLQRDPALGFIFTPCFIGDWKSAFLNFWHGSNELRISKDSFIEGIMLKPQLFPSSPCAYYFRRHELISALLFLRSVPALAPCTINGAGIDSLIMITVLAQNHIQFASYYPRPCTLFRSHSGSITVNDYNQGTGIVDSLRRLAFSIYKSNQNMWGQAFGHYRKELKRGAEHILPVVKG